MREVRFIDHEYKIIRSWNRTQKNYALVFYPNNFKEIKKLLKFIKVNKKNYIIKTGQCSYDSKSINPNDNTVVISLKKFNKILKVNKNKIIVQSGAIISELTEKIRKKNITLYSVPGGEKISVGGAISANVIGKDSTKEVASFGDAVKELHVLTDEGVVKKINRNVELSKYIGAFGFAGIILQAHLRIKKIHSNNLIIRTRSLNNLKDIENHLKKSCDYRYIQMDPFFRKNNYAISFDGNFTKNSINLFKKMNLNSNLFEKIIFKLVSYLINTFTWKFFYSLFFILNSNKKKMIDLHNYNYSSKYKHMVPLITKKGLIDYEVMIKNNFEGNMNKIIHFMKKNKLYPIYIIVKKTFKSKVKNYSYSFNENGYAVAISLDKKNINSFKQKNFISLLDRNNLKLNLSKTDEKIINKHEKRKKLFMSLYKKMVMERYDLPR